MAESGGDGRRLHRLLQRRSIWWDALKGFLAQELDREAAALQIADNYRHFVDVYQGQTVH